MATRTALRTKRDPPSAQYTADVVIVGAGVAGAILAKELVNSGSSVLLLEAGRATSIRPEGYASYVEHFQSALQKTPNSPYPQIPNAPSPSVMGQAQVKNGNPVTGGYHVYAGNLPFLSNYTRVLGGTTLHFLGTCMRMLPSDFTMHTTYGVGKDWPVSYDSMMPFYEQAELEMGVSADVAEQQREGAVFRDGYEYPMRQIPKSYLDRWLDRHLDNFKYKMGPDKLPVQVVGTPAGRNGMPNPNYIDPRTKQPYRPQGAPYDPRSGQRCEGNSACVPICPAMAKYNALRSLYTIDRKAAKRLQILTQTIATQVLLSENRKEVTGIQCRQYDQEASPSALDRQFTVRGRVYVIAAHSIETAKLLLASNAANSSDQVGRNLMDHPYFLTWGYAPETARVGVFRGPQITSELPMRDGRFRSEFAAFRADIRNGGWDFATGAPYSDVAALVSKGVIGTDGRGRPVHGGELFGRELRSQLHNRVQRQISFGFQIEQLPCPDNRVTIDDKYRDAAGNYRPVLHYDVDDYSRRAVLESLKLSKAVFRRVGGQDVTQFVPGAPGNIEIEGKTYTVYGAGHVVGTHCMGSSQKTSVVNTDQRTWDHHNLYLVGCGNMPTLGTSNPTLTAAALAYKAASDIKNELVGKGLS